MEILRKNESGIIPFRSGRFFNVETKWYFASREGVDYGPFDSKQQAEVSLDVFIQSVALIERKFKA